ncbi:MAG TPA: EamA family transporter, partial [Candidatus Wallbacteria bacterium]|nr:EamA family transporter [Candidatus Wallbacteria bacterium]
MVYLYLFSTIIFWTLGQFFLKIGFTRSNPVSSFILCGVTGFAVGFPFFYFADIKADFSDPWRFGAISVWAAMCYLTYYYAIEAGELAIASALVGTCPIWTAIFAVFVMGETLVTRQWFAAGAVVAGIMLLAISCGPEAAAAEVTAPFNNANASNAKWWTCVFISITCAVLTGVADAVTRVVVINKSVSTHLIYYWGAQIVIGLVLKAAIERNNFTFSSLFSKYSIIGMFSMN